MEPEVECDSCGWRGGVDELTDAPDDVGNWVYCPECGSTEILDYVEDEENE